MQLRVETIVNEPVEKAWEYYVNPKHIRAWNHASLDWHCPRATNDVRVNGEFNFRMVRRGRGPVARAEADEPSRGRAIRQQADMRDANDEEGFDFRGKYTDVVTHQKIAYTMDDGRRVVIAFEPLGNSTHINVAFDPENENPIEVQTGGWQSILDSYKRYTEEH